MMITKRLCLLMIILFPKFLVEMFFSVIYNIEKLKRFFICPEAVRHLDLKILFFFEDYEKFSPKLVLEPMTLGLRVSCSTD